MSFYRKSNENLSHISHSRLPSLPEDADIELAPRMEEGLYRREAVMGGAKDAAKKVRSKTTGTTLKDGMAPSPEQEALLSTRASHWQHGLGLLKKADDFVVREVESTNTWTSIMSVIGFTTNKAYEVVDKTSGKVLLLAEERAGFLNRNCIHPECRPVKFHVYAYQNGETHHMMYVERGCSTVGKWKKPLVLRSSELDDSEIFGTVKNGSNAKNIDLTMTDARGNETITLRGSQCTAARWFGKLPCKACQRLTYNFYSPGSDIEKAGSMYSQWNGCCQEIVMDVSQYDLDLQSMTDLEKAEVIAAAIYSDIRYVQTGANLRDIILKKVTRFTVCQKCGQACGETARAITRTTA